LREICENAGVRLEFLPPYSPDFNPIEEAFAELKAWMRKNNTLTDGYESFEGFLEAGLRFISRKPGKHFRSCHIQI
jgi:transposase